MTIWPFDDQRTRRAMGIGKTRRGSIDKSEQAKEIKGDEERRYR